MKKMLLSTVLAMAVVPAVLFAADLDVSVSIGQPGFYGRLDIGDYPQPQVIYQQPRYIYRATANRPPIYLHVPPGHAKNWRKHCHRYDACGERVYFVQDNWYQQEYVPRYQERNRNDRDGRRGDEYGDRHGNGRGNDHDRGNGNGKEKGKGNDR